MERAAFENMVEEAFERLPVRFRQAIENVGVYVEDYPDDELVAQMRLQSRKQLLGLYQGIPLTSRGTWYGMSPVTPDKITLYQKNIEARANTSEEIAARIYEVLVHEIGHYFGMSEEEIRHAGY